MALPSKFKQRALSAVRDYGRVCVVIAHRGKLLVYRATVIAEENDPDFTCVMVCLDGNPYSYRSYVEKALCFPISQYNEIARKFGPFGRKPDNVRAWPLD